tara:strand:+ start:37161 stop:37844 length:684 start_codon:yes stop_codon:yes gene_type:complete
MKRLLGVGAVIGAALLPMAANATLIYDNWDTNEGSSGNYILTVDHRIATNQFDLNFTVSPWNAEGLGLFIDLGDFDLTGPVGLTNVAPVNEVTLFATDTASNSCGPGCNLNGLNPTLLQPDDEWELVFRLASQGFDNIQTFSFSINDLGLTESAFGMVGIRAQQLCSGNALLPDGACGGSDKSIGTPRTPEPDPDPDPDPNPVPAPQTLLMFALGLFTLAWFRRRAV